MNCLKSVLKLATDQLFHASDSAALDAEILLCLAIGKERTYLRTWPEKLLEPEQISQMEASAQGFAKLNNWTVSQPPEWQTLQKLLEAF